MLTFYLGAPNSAWLHRHAEAPLFVSRRQMPKRDFRKAIVDWACDSGGFTELQKFGTWTLNAWEYANLIKIYDEKVGRLQWAAPQDWMCEPVVIHGGSVGGGKNSQVRNYP